MRFIKNTDRAGYDNDGQSAKEQINFFLDADIYKYLYTKNQIQTNIDQTQFRSVSWKAELGVHVGSYLDVFMYHYSEHVLDRAASIEYPNSLGAGVTLHLLKQEPGK